MVTERNNSHLLNGGDDMGMTDNQYKGMLLDQLEDWQPETPKFRRRLRNRSRRSTKS